MLDDVVCAKMEVTQRLFMKLKVIISHTEGNVANTIRLI